MARKSIPHPNDSPGSLLSHNSAKEAGLHYEQYKIALRLVDLGYEDILKAWTFNHTDPRAAAQMLQLLSDLDQEFPTQKNGYRKPKLVSSS